MTAAEVSEHVEDVIIVEAGPSGLAVTVCLSLCGVHSLMLERDDCVASLWRHRTYDSIRLHLTKHHCALPHVPHDAATPTYLLRDDFLHYLDAYADCFVVRSYLRCELHLVSKEIWNVAMTLYRFMPLWVIDKIVLLMCAIVFGDTARYGLRRPTIGPFTMKLTTPVYPIVDVGTFSKIRSGEIRDSTVEFTDGKRHDFDAIIFATSYRSTIKQWLKSDDSLIGDDGMARRSYPEHWKGENGLYCAGLVRRGIYGCCEDAEFIAGDISRQQQQRRSSKPHDDGDNGNGSG
ncbi:hypothetical protein ABZP36_017571 [Zizania latifolia]